MDENCMGYEALSLDQYLKIEKSTASASAAAQTTQILYSLWTIFFETYVTDKNWSKKNKN